MFGTCLSNTKQANSGSLFTASPSVLQSSLQPNGDSLTLWNELCPLAALPYRAVFPFLSAMSASVTCSGLNGVQSLCFAVLSASSACCHWLGETHTLPAEKCPVQLQRQARHQNTGRGRCVSIHSHHHTCIEAQK